MLYTNADYDRRLKEEGKKNKSNADWRTEFRRDFSRLIHSPSYRRLQGKTQVFPGVESDFFRNRITHSQEVAQVAKSIALMFNEREEFFKRKGKIDLDLVEFAGLAHDLGHPPFGHNGEKALDECMLEYGGFEGNAQTLRILSKVEKKVKGPKSNGEGILSNGKDMRFGLNLTYRSLASILKYDAEIPLKREDGANLVKGYYASERDLVQKIKDNFKVTGLPSVKFKTLECTIMDIADDIAYSTFDLEDAFKSGILSPLDLLSLTDPIIEVIREKVAKSMGKPYAADDIKRILASFFLDKFRPHLENVRSNFDHRAELSTDILPQIMGGGFAITREIGRNGYLRTELSSELIDEFMGGVRFKPNEEFPFLSEAYLDPQTLELVEVVKQFVFTSIIMSSRLQVPEYRGTEIVKQIFTALSDHDKNGQRLLPDDCRVLHDSFKTEVERKRVICDFIAGMTDRYAIEFYGRLKSENPQSLFKPLN